MAAPTVDQAFATFQRTGDPGALAVVFDATAPELLRVAAHLTQDLNVAEDLVQSTFLAAIEDRSSWNAAQPVLPWLLGILANRARRVRREAARPLDATRLVPDEPLSPPDVAEAEELSQAVSDAIASLPEVYRPVLNLHLRNHLSAQQIALSLERPSGTVRTQIVRGLELLRNALPRSLAVGALAAVVTGRGLAAMRTQVLAAAAHVAAPAALHSTLLLGGGLFAMKKIAIPVVLLALLGSIALLVPWQRDVRESPAAPDASASVPPAATATASAPAAGASSLGRAAAPAPRERDGLATLIVTVLWSDRAAAANVHVRLWPSEAAMPELHEQIARTDDQGRAQFTRLPPGAFEVATDRSMAERVTLTADETTQRELVLADGVTCEGSVVDARGQPVGGATVWLGGTAAPGGNLLGRGARRGWELDDGCAVATTDARGAFQVRALSGERVLWATASGHGASAAIKREARGLVLRLRDGGALLSGRVLDESTRPIEGALVLSGRVLSAEVLSQKFMFDDERLRLPSSRARTGADGRFTIADPPPGAWLDVFVRAGGFAVERLRVKPEERPRELVIRLQRGATLFGNVRDKSGAGVANAHFYIQHPDVDDGANSYPGWLRTTARAGAGGAFRIDGLRAGKSTVRVRAMVARSDDLLAWAELELQNGEERRFDPVVSVGDVIAGIVVDEAGAPAAGVDVSAEGSKERKIARTTSDANGRFALDGCETDCDYTLYARQRVQGEGVLATRTGVRAPIENLQLVIRRTRLEKGVLTGIALDRAEQPFKESIMLWGYEKGGYAMPKPVDAEGRFRFDDLAVGRYTVHVNQPRKAGSKPTMLGGKAWPAVFGPFEVRAGETTDVGRLRVPEPGVVQAHVVDEKGEGVSGWAMLQPVAGLNIIAPLRNGDWSDEEVAPGRYVFFMYHPTLTAMHRVIEVESGKTTKVELQLSRGVVQEIVAPEDFALEVEMFCTWCDGDGNTLWKERWTPGREGKRPHRWTRTLPEGRWRVVLDSADGKHAEAVFAVSLAQPSPAPVQLRAK